MGDYSFEDLIPCFFWQVFNIEPPSVTLDTAGLTHAGGKVYWVDEKNDAFDFESLQQRTHKRYIIETIPAIKINSISSVILQRLGRSSKICPDQVLILSLATLAERWPVPSMNDSDRYYWLLYIWNGMFLLAYNHELNKSGPVLLTSLFDMEHFDELLMNGMLDGEMEGILTVANSKFINQSIQQIKRMSITGMSIFLHNLRQTD